MRLYLTDAIILDKRPHGEADVLATMLTKDFGKIRAVAQGARKQEAKLKGHLEPMARSRVGFIIGKNFYRLTSAEMLDHYAGLRAEPEALRCASYVMHLVDRNTFEERGDPRLFELVAETFQRLNAPSGEEVVHDFHVRLLDILGLLPDFAGETASAGTAGREGLHVGLVNSLVREHLDLRYDPSFGIMELA